MSRFKKATKKRARARIALVGPSGSGKTYSSLAIGKHLAPGGKIAVIDTERGSASKYAGDAADFDALELEVFAPEEYVSAIQDAADECAIIDVCLLASLGYFENSSPPNSAAAVDAGGASAPNDNCDCGNCTCNSSGHYVWYWNNTDEQVVSLCTGAACTATDADGYQDVFP